MGRLKTLEKRAAWAFLGVAGEGHVSQVEIKKAFKRRALELHPDKGGDAERFRLLQAVLSLGELSCWALVQEMRDLLVEPKRHELEGGQEGSKAVGMASRIGGEEGAGQEAGEGRRRGGGRGGGLLGRQLGCGRGVSEDVPEAEVAWRPSNRTQRVKNGNGLKRGGHLQKLTCEN